MWKFKYLNLNFKLMYIRSSPCPLGFSETEIFYNHTSETEIFYHHALIVRYYKEMAKG